MAKRKYRHKLKKKPSRHHVIPSSRGGTSNLENIAGLTVKNHQTYHALFENKTPSEIVEYLVNDYWNGQWSHVYNAYERNNNGKI